MAVEVTRKEYLKLWRDDRYISQHTKIIEAVERASQDAETHESPGIYQVKIGDTVFYEVEVTFILGSGGEIEETQPEIPSSNWPVNWPNRAFAQQSSNDDQLNDEPWRSYLAELDLVIFQGRYPTQAKVTEHAGWFASFKNLNGGKCKLIGYTHMFGLFPGGTSKLQYLGYEVASSYSDPGSWRAKNTAGQLLYGDGDQQDFEMCNLAFHLTTKVDIGAGSSNLAEAWAREFFFRIDGSKWSTDSHLQYQSGWYLDSTDMKDTQPGYVQPQFGTPDRPDYNQDGSADSSGDNTEHASDPEQDGGAVMNRKGVAELVRAIKQEYTGSEEWAVLSNGGRDRTQFNDGTPANFFTTHTWSNPKGLFDARQFESSDETLGLEKTGTGYQITVSNPATWFNRFWEHVYISKEFCDQTSANLLAKDVNRGYVYCECSINTNGTSLAADMTSDDFEKLRFWDALTMQSLWAAQAPHFNKLNGCPPPDEYHFDIGAPVGTPSMGSITDAGVFTLRADDGNGFYYQEYENGIKVINANSPTGSGAAWPQAATDTFTFPSAGAGKKWQALDAANYQNPVTGIWMRGQDTTVNDGADMGATVEIPRWHGRTYARVDV